MKDEFKDVQDLSKKKPSRWYFSGLSKVNPKKLENAALNYLQRFSTSSEHLRRVLMRQVLRAAHRYDTDVEEASVWVDEVVAKMYERGFVNDQTFAEGRVHSLLARGVPLRGIRFQLHNKGVDEDIIDEVLCRAEDDLGDINFAAAVSLAKRRRLGPFSRNSCGLKKREKDIGSLVRAGFDSDTIRRIMDAETTEDIEVKKTHKLE